MFRWYRNAVRCYVYLSDVSTREDLSNLQHPWESLFTQSRWFTRGWTLQELLAPQSVQFFSREGTWLGDKKSLEPQICQITSIAAEALQGYPLSQFSVEERMAWTARRETTREEDQAYCLIGIFDISLAIIYGEGKVKALLRLQKELEKTSEDNKLSLVNMAKVERECLKTLRSLGYDQLERGPLFDSTTVDGETPLSWSSANGHEAAVELLLATGLVDADAKDNHGITPLWRAAVKGHEAIVQRLLNTGFVNINTKNKTGQTPLMGAAKNRHAAVVKLLLDTGKADVNAMDKTKRTVLSYAADSGREMIVKMLLDTGKVNVDEQAKDGQNALLGSSRYGYEAVVKLLLDTGKADAGLKDIYNRTALLWAARNGYEAVVKLLLETGKADVEAKAEFEGDFMEIGRSDGWTALSWACVNGHEGVIKLLLNMGKADVNAKDKAGRTAISLVAETGNEAMVKLLLSTGKADLKLRDEFDRTAWKWATEKGHHSVGNLLHEWEYLRHRSR